MPGFKPTLDPEAPGLDEATWRRRRALAKLEAMPTADLFNVAVLAGIYTIDGKLTERYQDGGDASACRPTG